MNFDPTILRKIRENHGLSQDYIAKRMGWSSRSTYQKRESGEVELTVNELLKLVTILGIKDIKILFKK